MNKIISLLKRKPTIISSIIGFFVLIDVLAINKSCDFLYKVSYLPYAEIITPIIDIVCIILSLITIFSSHFIILYCIGLFLLGLINIMNGNELIGGILTFVIIAMLMSDGFFHKISAKKIILIIILWIIESALVYPLGIRRFVYFEKVNIFLVSSFISCFLMIKNRFSPANISEKIYESKDYVCDLSTEKKLTMRQKKCLNILVNNPEYTFMNIANELNVSESVVKKEMRMIYDIFGIKGISELRRVLMNVNIIF